MKTQSFISGIVVFFVSLLFFLPNVLLWNVGDFPRTTISVDDTFATFPLFIGGLLISYFLVQGIGGRRFTKKSLFSPNVFLAVLLAGFTFYILTAIPFARNFEGPSISRGHGGDGINLFSYLPLIGVIILLTEKKYYTYVDAQRRYAATTKLNIPIAVPIALIILFVIAVIFAYINAS